MVGVESCEVLALVTGKVVCLVFGWVEGMDVAEVIGQWCCGQLIWMKVTTLIG